MVHLISTILKAPVLTVVLCHLFTNKFLYFLQINSAQNIKKRCSRWGMVKSGAGGILTHTLIEEGWKTLGETV
jgi:hypothetical protein